VISLDDHWFGPFHFFLARRFTPYALAPFGLKVL
jgi:hypothetical protein